MLQFGASLTDNTSSVNYDFNMFIIQATDDEAKQARGFVLGNLSSQVSEFEGRARANPIINPHHQQQKNKVL
jgi:hypothetical protein